MLDEVEDLLDKCYPIAPPGFYSTYFMVPKKDGGFRLILNLKLFSWFLVQESFKMETLQSILLAAQPGTWLASIDLMDAYFHILIFRTNWKYLRFCLKGKCYQYKVSLFGLEPAPRLFT